MSRIKVGVCEIAPELRPGSSEWKALCRAVSREAPDLFLLSELPFGRWIAAGPAFDAGAWAESCSIHDRGLALLGELGAAVVAATRPREHARRRLNEGFVWSRQESMRAVHAKQQFPDEEDYYERRWFTAGARTFDLTETAAIRAGFLICTEVMFNEQARRYGRAGGQVILVPRAVGDQSLGRWQVAMRMAAIVSGCYVLSSNRGGTDSRGQAFGGRGWVVDPAGEVVAETSPATPVVFHEIDTDRVARAQASYPCYVDDEAAPGESAVPAVAGRSRAGDGPFAHAAGFLLHRE